MLAAALGAVLTTSAVTPVTTRFVVTCNLVGARAPGAMLGQGPLSRPAFCLWELTHQLPLVLFPLARSSPFFLPFYLSTSALLPLCPPPPPALSPTSTFSSTPSV